MTIEEASGPPVEIWLENMATVNVFIAMGTQWRIGMNGATGLDYGVLQGVMRLIGIPRKDWQIVFDGVRIMEHAALEEMRKE